MRLDGWEYSEWGMPAMNIFKNRYGFSLMEVTVTAGVLAVVIGGSLASFEMMTKMNASAEAQAQMGSLMTEANAVVGSSNSCTTALAGTTSQNNQAIALSPILQAGQAYSRNVNIDSITLENVSVVQGITRRADVTINLSKNRFLTTGGDNFPTASSRSRRRPWHTAGAGACGS